jgi:hypothetical protein
MAIQEADPDTSLLEQRVIEENSTQPARENIEEIRKTAEAFDGAAWTTYPAFFKELQAKRHQEFDRYYGIRSAEDLE